MKSRTFILILFFILLCGCGDKSENAVRNNIYKENAVDISINENEIFVDAIIDNGYLYALTTVAENDNSIPQISIYDEQGTTISKYSVELKSSANDAIYIYNFFSLGDRLFFLYDKESLDENDDYGYFCATCDKSGTGLFVINLTNQEEIRYSNSVYPLDNYFLLDCNKGLFLFDKDLNVVMQKKTVSFDRFYYLGEDNGFVRCDSEKETVYYNFNILELEIGEQINVTQNFDAFDLYMGSEEMYLYDGQNLYSYDITSDVLSTKVDYYYSGIYVHGILKDICDEPDGTIHQVAIEYAGEKEHIHLSTLTKLPAEEYTERKVIKIGCLSSPKYIWNEIYEYNRTNCKYVLEIVDYSSLITDENDNADIEAFEKDLLKKNAPDIFFCDGRSNASLQNYIYKGGFKDLSNYINSDPDIDVKNIFPNVLDACSNRGRIYTIIPKFGIKTVVSVGNNDLQNGNFEDFLSEVANKPEYFDCYTRSVFLSMFLMYEGNPFFDLKEGTCNFEGENFHKLLSYAEDIPGERGIESSYFGQDIKYKPGYAAITLFGISDYNSIREIQCGGQMNIVGFPSETGNGSYIVPVDVILGISKTSKNADEAWNFVRKFLLPDYQNSIEYYFPSMMDVYERKALDEIARHPDGYIVNDYDDLIYPIYTEEDVYELKDFVSVSNANEITDYTVISIVEEEAENYFQGISSAEEVGKKIQSRVTLYFEERK